MARFDNAYSRAIAIAKLVLPLVALAILSTLFLLSRPAPVGEPLPYSDLELGDLAREQRLGAPVFTGVTEDGSQMQISARSLTPDPDQTGIVHGTDLVANVNRPDGFGYSLRAETGTLNDKDHVANLGGGIRIETSNGYVITTQGARIRTNLTRLDTTAPVEADGPLGQLSAGGLTITGDGNSGKDMVAVFTDGVKLVYLPAGAPGP